MHDQTIYLIIPDRVMQYISSLPIYSVLFLFVQNNNKNKLVTFLEKDKRMLCFEFFTN